jgi:hypothetical protein
LSPERAAFALLAAFFAPFDAAAFGGMFASAMKGRSVGERIYVRRRSKLVT